MRRRSLLSLPALAASYPVRAQAPLALLTAGPGSAFLPYGEGLAAFLGRQGISTTVRRTTGSLQNLSMVEDDPNALGTAFLGSAWDALQGTPAAAGVVTPRCGALPDVRDQLPSRGAAREWHHRVRPPRQAARRLRSSARAG